MKTITFLITGLIALAFSSFTVADVYVEGHIRSDGTYVAPHYRSSPNSTRNDNWSTRGNVNPYTGKRGTKAPEYGYGSPKPRSQRSQKSSPYYNPYD